MRIGIDARPLSWPGKGGIPRVCSELVAALMLVGSEHEYVVFTTKRPLSSSIIAERVEVLDGSPVWYSLYALPKAVKRHRCDVVLGLSPETLRVTIPTVQVVYDVYPKFYGEWLPRRYACTGTYLRHRIQTFVRLRSLKAMAGVVAVSEATLGDIWNYIDHARTATGVASPGHSRGWGRRWTEEEARTYIKERWNVHGEYFLYVGSINYNKNCHTLVQAFQRFRVSTQGQVSLLLVGTESWPYLPQNSLLDVEGVIRIPDAEDGELGALYTGALGFICLSFYEGFGIPVLEAMAHGSPVIVSDRGSLPEVAGEAGIIVSPTDQDSIVSAMEDLAMSTEKREGLRVLSRRRSEEYSWEKEAQEVLAVLRSVVDRNRSR